jgi:hypothetical protein
MNLEEEEELIVFRTDAPLSGVVFSAGDFTEWSSIIVTSLIGVVY